MSKHSPEHATLYKTLFRTHPYAMLIIDPDTGAIMDANTAAQNLYNYTQKEFVQLHIAQINTLDSDDIGLLSGYAKDDLPARHRHRLKDGRFTDVMVHTDTFEFKGRTLLRSTIEHITCKHHGHSTSTHNENIIQAILEASKSLVYLFTSKGDIIHVNTPGARLFNLTPEQMTGENFKQYFSDNDYSRLKILVDDIIQNKTPINYQKGRDDRFYDIILHPVFNAQNEVESLCALAYDISDLKKTQKVFSAVDNAGNLCHTMNQPLQVIGGNLELLRLKLGKHAPGINYLENVTSHVEKLGKIIKKLSHITRHETKEYMRGTVFDIDTPKDTK